MIRETIGEGATVPEAIDAALEELGVQQDAVEYEVLDEGGRKLLGLGGEKGARVKVWLKGDFVDELAEAKQVAREILDVEEEPAEGADAEPSEDEAPESTPADADAEEEPELTEEDLDRIADTAVAVLKEIVLAGFGVESEIEEYEGDEGEIILDIVGDDLGVLIGRHGKTLDGIQTLVGAATRRKVGIRHPVIVDVEGYRHRRRAKLEQIARRSADRADRDGDEVRLRPMTSYERRVVHMILRDDSRVETGSEGEEPFRCVVITPK
jgi:spoIIIJ-associated protein